MHVQGLQLRPAKVELQLSGENRANSRIDSAILWPRANEVKFTLATSRLVSTLATPALIEVLVKMHSDGSLLGILFACSRIMPSSTRPFWFSFLHFLSFYHQFLVF